MGAAVKWCASMMRARVGRPPQPPEMSTAQVSAPLDVNARRVFVFTHTHTIHTSVAAKAIMVWQECKALKAQLAMSQAAGNEAAEEVFVKSAHTYSLQSVCEPSETEATVCWHQPARRWRRSAFASSA